MVISRRLNRLSESCNQVLIIASVLGREFGLNQLKHILDKQTFDSILEAVEEALSVSLIEEVIGTAGRYRFTHALVQEAVASQLSAARRAHIHSRIALALEELYISHTSAQVVELAHHFSESGAVGHTGKVVQYLRIAGERALATYAPEEALVHFGRALEVKATQPMDSETAFILVSLSRALILLGKIEEAMPHLTSAFHYYEESGDIDRAVDVAELSSFPDIVDPRLQITRLRERALNLVPPDSHEAGRLLCQYGRYQYHKADYETARDFLGRALSIARREDDKSLEMRILANWAHLELFNLNTPGFFEKAFRAIELAQEVGNSYTEAWMRQWTGFNLLTTGNPEKARRQAEVLLNNGQRLRARRRIAGALHLNQAVFQFAGNWPAAREYINRGLALDSLDGYLLCNLVLLEYEIGNFSEGDSCLERWLEHIRNIPPDASFNHAITSVLLPKLTAGSDIGNRLEFAESAARVILSSSYADPLLELHAGIALSLIAARRGDRKMAAEQNLTQIAKMKGIMTPWGNISIDRLLGILTQTRGQIDAAEGHFNDAVTFCRRASYRPELAWTCFDYAGLLLERNDPDNRKKALAYLNEGMAITQELGMRPLEEHITERLAAINARSNKLDTPTFTLTKREMEVMRLIARGKTNQEIAYELFISEHTVGNHVSSLLAKTKTTNRTEAAMYAAQHSLIAD